MSVFFLLNSFLVLFPLIIHLGFLAMPVILYLDLTTRFIQCIFLGFPLDYKGYLCFDYENSMLLISRHVIFDECLFLAINFYKKLTSPLQLLFSSMVFLAYLFSFFSKSLWILLFCTLTLYTFFSIHHFTYPLPIMYQLILPPLLPSQS